MPKASPWKVWKFGKAIASWREGFDSGLNLINVNYIDCRIVIVAHQNPIRLRQAVSFRLSLCGHMPENQSPSHETTICRGILLGSGVPKRCPAPGMMNNSACGIRSRTLASRAQQAHIGRYGQNEYLQRRWGIEATFFKTIFSRRSHDPDNSPETEQEKANDCTDRKCPTQFRVEKRLFQVRNICCSQRTKQ